ncbi:hypothetical protein FHU38_003429 [Saccharomonospora amisosensis]|uniref:Polyketide cyclase / dehydrase and lipid transport n=1 Tax=Saccharomonospora amisosensis TaxID=1128677 RepID=A0A7X5URY2_9PSEU|nr:hypothetical protein [Saccharomonospora amisosensis]NIJ13085.1 hypothetical protein [Saccharomonospora amisosensis]
MPTTQERRATTESTMLADRFAPRYDVIQTEHVVVDASPERAYEFVRALDFTDVHTTLVDAVQWLRALPQRWRERKHGPPRTPTRMTFDDMATGSDWVILGETPGREIAAGAAGRFWKPVVEWRPVEAERFTEFAEPGYGKIVMSLSTRPYGENSSLVSYDIRVILNDTLSAAKFNVYWKTIAPFVRAIQKAVLNTVKRDAEQQAK